MIPFKHEFAAPVKSGTTTKDTTPYIVVKQLANESAVVKFYPKAVKVLNLKPEATEETEAPAEQQKVAFVKDADSNQWVVFNSTGIAEVPEKSHRVLTGSNTIRLSKDEVKAGISVLGFNTDETVLNLVALGIDGFTGFKLEVGEPLINTKSDTAIFNTELIAIYKPTVMAFDMKSYQSWLKDKASKFIAANNLPAGTKYTKFDKTAFKAFVSSSK